MQMSRGESKTFTFTCVDTAGDPIDLTGALVTFLVTDLVGATVLELTSADTDEVEVTDEEGGVFDVKITAAQSDLEPTARWADAKALTAAGQTLRVTEREPFYVTGSAL